MRPLKLSLLLMFFVVFFFFSVLQMYLNTKDYVNNRFVKPVLNRAGSFKHIGSHAADAAVDTLDGLIDWSDKYIDHYLPADADPSEKIPEGIYKTFKTIS